MTGLDKIIEKIAEASDERCAQMTEKAENEAKAIEEQAKKDGSEMAEKVIAEAEVKAKNIVDMAKSGAQLAEKKIILNARSEMINDVIEKAIDLLKSLPEDKYFSAMTTLFENNVQKGEGKMLLSEKDLKRLPKSFEQSVTSKGVSISGDPADIDGGFILVYGDIEINCTFDALAESFRDELKDKVNEILF